MGFQAIRYAVRSLVFDRGVSAIVILCLALGIGVNATLFSVIDGILIQPLPFAEPDRLLILNETFERGGVRDAGVSYQNLRDWKRARRRSRRSRRWPAAASRCPIRASRSGSRARRSRGICFRCSACRRRSAVTSTSEDDRPGAEPVRDPQRRGVAAPLPRRSRASSAAASPSTAGRTPWSASCRRIQLSRKTSRLDSARADRRHRSRGATATCSRSAG